MPRQEYDKIGIVGLEERNTVTEKKRWDTDRHREYNRLRMRAISKSDRQNRKLSRFSSLLAKIREYEADGLSDEEIVRRRI